jgi:hypothetical protein
VIPGLEDFHLFVVGAVHEPMFVVDAAGPVAGQVTFQGFRLTYPGERVALDLADQARDPDRHLPICGQPVQEVLPGLGVEVDASQLLTRQRLEVIHGLDDGRLMRLVPCDGFHEPLGVGGRP